MKNIYIDRVEMTEISQSFENFGYDV